METNYASSFTSFSLGVIIINIELFVLVPLVALVNSDSCN